MSGRLELRYGYDLWLMVAVRLVYLPRSHSSSDPVGRAKFSFQRDGFAESFNATDTSRPTPAALLTIRYASKHIIGTRGACHAYTNASKRIG